MCKDWKRRGGKKTPLQIKNTWKIQQSANYLNYKEVQQSCQRMVSLQKSKHHLTKAKVKNYPRIDQDYRISIWKWKWRSLSCAWLFVTPWNFPGQNTGVGSLSLLQWIFLTQELNQGLLHCRWILYQLPGKLLYGQRTMQMYRTQR